MKKLFAVFLLLGVILITQGNEDNTSDEQSSQDKRHDIKIKSLELDGFRYIKELHKDTDVQVFWNNGVYGKGLMLSFFGKLDSQILNMESMTIDKVVLADGTKLDSKKIRQHKTGFDLGNDRKSFGFRVDLDTRTTNIKHISGKLEVTQAFGIIEKTSGLLEDKVKSEENQLGISIKIASGWLSGRYFLLLIENAGNIQNLTMLDEDGNEIRQFQPFSVTGSKNENVKVYVDKEEGKPFSIRLTKAKKLLTQTVPFVIENIDLMSY